MKTCDDPEHPRGLARRVQKAPLRERAIHVLGSDGAKVLQELRAACDRRGSMSRDEFDTQTTTILSYTARLEGRTDRVKYFKAAIRNEIRKHELTCWLEAYPDMFDFLTDEDVRNIPKKERDAYDTARAKVVAELNQIKGVQPGLLFEKRVGKDEAKRLTALICKKIDIATVDGFRRYVSIIRGAAKQTVRHPDKYIVACLRKLRTKSKRNCTHGHKPNPTD